MKNSTGFFNGCSLLRQYFSHYSKNYNKFSSKITEHSGNGLRTRKHKNEFSNLHKIRKQTIGIMTYALKNLVEWFYSKEESLKYTVGLFVEYKFENILRIATSLSSCIFTTPHSTSVFERNPKFIHVLSRSTRILKNDKDGH